MFFGSDLRSLFRRGSIAEKGYGNSPGLSNDGLVMALIQGALRPLFTQTEGGEGREEHGTYQFLTPPVGILISNRGF